MRETRYSVFEDGRVLFRYQEPGAQKNFEAEIRCPIPSRLHADHRTIMERHRQWASSFNIPSADERYQRYCDTRLDLLSSYQCYDLSLDAAVVHSHLMSWFFVFDDVMDIDHGLGEDARSYAARLWKRHLEILSGAPRVKGDPGSIRAFSDYLQKVERLGAEGTGYWYERMKHHLREYILGAYWESLIGPTTEINTNTAMYLQVRHMTVGVAPCLDLMAIASRIPSAPITGNFFLQRLERMAINYSIWINDLAGLNRDMKRRLGNVVFTLQRDYGLSIIEATSMLARMCDGELNAFLEVERELPLLLGNEYEKDRNVYEAYIGVLKHWMRGLLDWSARSERYQRLDVDMALQNKASIRLAHTKNRFEAD